jgi:hypothetical protein
MGYFGYGELPLVLMMIRRSRPGWRSSRPAWPA